MAKSSGALPQRTGPDTATWAEREAAAWRAAEHEIGRLPAGEALVYHEGNLAIDIENDPEIAGRAAAFRAAAEAARGTLAQRRLAFECYQYMFWRSHRD
jgi:hypothetical protein